MPKAYLMTVAKTYRSVSLDGIGCATLDGSDPWAEKNYSEYLARAIHGIRNRHPVKMLDHMRVRDQGFGRLRTPNPDG